MRYYMHLNTFADTSYHNFIFRIMNLLEIYVVIPINYRSVEYCQMKKRLKPFIFRNNVLQFSLL